MKKNILALLAASSFFFPSSELPAYESYCNDTFWSNSNWACWVGGALLGAAAGAGTGYAASHNRGKRGKQGPTGSIGPAGPGGFVQNTTESLVVFLDRTSLPETSVVFQFQLVNPEGVVLFSQDFVGPSMMPDEIINIPAETPKPQGNYLVRWTIVSGVGMFEPATSLGTLIVLIDGNLTDEIFTPIVGWRFPNEFLLNYFTFP